MKNKSNFGIISLIAILLIVNGCKKNQEEETSITTTIRGYAQKGPFLNGATISLFELNDDFSPTGNVFSSQINDALGSFQISNVTLASNYATIRTDGFYFNEVCGENSQSQITLTSILDVSNSSTMNVNLLTHLEKQRVENLLSSGLPLELAKKQAQAEVLNIFSISDTNIENSELLDISNSGNGNAILLAVSVILQGFRTESELSSLLSFISTDISSDGELNNTSIQSSLIDQALLLDTAQIRNNVTQYYQNMGIAPTLSNFGFYIQNFINNSEYEITNSTIVYPPMGNYGENVLVKDQLNYTGGTCSMKVSSKKCANVKIRIQALNNTIFGYYLGTASNWSISVYNSISQDQFYTVLDPEQSSDIGLSFQTGGSYLIEYYEKESTTPTFSKVINVN